jgi:hypothetical protein
VKRLGRVLPLALASAAVVAVPFAGFARAAASDLQRWPHCTSAVGAAHEMAAAVPKPTTLLGYFNPRAYFGADVFECTALTNKAEVSVEIFCGLADAGAVRLREIGRQFFYTGIYRGETPYIPIGGIGEQALFMTEAKAQVKSKEAAVAARSGRTIVLVAGATGQKMLAPTAVPTVPLPRAPLVEIAKAVLRFSCKRPG